MSRQQRGGGAGEVARGAGYAAFLGAVLIAVAVVIGIILLQIGDRNDNGPKSAGPKTTSSTTTTTTHKTSTSKPHTTTTPTAPAVSASLVKIVVLNGGALTGQAGVMSSELRGKGYTNQLPASDWTG